MSEIVTKPLLVSIVGPTAVGKTSIAIALAQTFGTEIISSDSRQFYRELEIGTAKPSHEELLAVKHHFINSHSIDELYSAGEYGRDAMQVLEELYKKKKLVIAVGGSSLYLKALWEGFDKIPEVEPSVREQLNDEFQKAGLEKLLTELESSDPEYFEVVDKRNGQRIIRALEVIRGTGEKFSSFRKSSVNESPYENLKIGLDMERETLFNRIDQRMDQMIESGLFEEASGLISYKNHNALQTVGYTEIFDFMDGKYDKEESVRLLKRNSRRYAKRQLTWFRRYEDINWYKPDQKEEIIEVINKTLNT